MTHVSYANPIRETYDLGPAAVQFGAQGETVGYEFIGPKGRKGLVRDIEIEVTENMVGTTTVPEVNVGSAVSALGALKKEYARWRLGTAAGTGYTTAVSPNPLRARSLVAGNGEQQVLNDFTEHVALETAFIPADTPFFVSLVEGDGGSETGAGRVRVYVDWL
jgi:hypothetical protein